MIFWLPVLAAFCLGLAAACLLEAGRLHHDGKRPWSYSLLAGLCLCLALGLWLNGRAAPPTPFTASNRQLAPGHSSQPLDPTLPPPLLTLLSQNTPPLTNHAAPMMDNGLRMTDNGLRDTPWSRSAITRPKSPPTRLHIPALKINSTIVPAPLRDGAWDVDGLGSSVGLLATAGQYPGDTLAMVLAGHMTFPDGNLLEQGAFAELQYATYGMEVLVEAGGQTAVYQVVEINRIAPDAVNRLYLEDGDTILLLTCTDWNEDTYLYANRLLVRAIRVERE